MAIEVKVLTGTEIVTDAALIEEIISLDELNMGPIMLASGYQDFPWNRRLSNLTRPETKFFGLFQHNKLLGYLEICHDLDNQYIELNSVQIHPSYQHGHLFRKLLIVAIEHLQNTGPASVKSKVQKSNLRMIKIFKKLGLHLSESSKSHTLIVTGDLETLLKAKLLRRILSE